MEKVDWQKVKPYHFEEFWEHMQHSLQFMHHDHVTYGGKIHDMPKGSQGVGSMPWVYGE